MQRTSLSLLLLSALLGAAPPQRDIRVDSPDRILSHIAFGGGWTTTLTLVNLYTEPAELQITFYDDNGVPLPVNTNTSQGVTSLYRTNLGVRNSQRILLSGDATVRSGWAHVEYNWNVAVVGVSSVFRLSIAGRPDYEAVVWATRPFYAIRVPFDETSSFSTGLAICNPNGTGSINLKITVRDESGAAINPTPVRITLVSRGHTAFALTDNSELRPLVLNRRGVLDIVEESSKTIGVLGLRFSPTFSFTTTVPWDLEWGSY